MQSAPPVQRTSTRLRTKRRRELHVADLDDVASICHRHLPFCLDLDKDISFRRPSPPPDSFALWYEGAEEEGGRDGNGNVLARPTPLDAREAERRREDALIVRAPLKRARTDAQLAAPSEASGFLQSDGTVLGPGALSVRHKFWKHKRQGVVSSDHVHVDHAHPRRAWTVRMARSKQNWKGAFFGLTAASGFQHRGATTCFDLFGNELRGESPLSMTGCWDTPFKVEPGVCADSAVRITADLREQTCTWEVFAGPHVEEEEEPLHRLVRPLGGATWRSARLFVFLRDVDDCVVLEP